MERNTLAFKSRQMMNQTVLGVNIVNDSEMLGKFEAAFGAREQVEHLLEQEIEDQKQYQED